MLKLSCHPGKPILKSKLSMNNLYHDFFYSYLTRWFLLIGCIWVLVSVATHALSNAMNDFAHTLIFRDSASHVLQE